MKQIVFIAQCSCGWVSDEYPSCAKAAKAAKGHDDDTAHGYDVPLFEELS